MMKVGVLGGSGVYDLEGLKNVKHKKIRTSYGAPSDDYIIGELGGVQVCFLPRHGRGHRILPSELNHRANIMGFKMLGCDRIISVSAVGSLKESLRPRDIVLPDQYFDRTKKSLEHTFFGGGIVAHVPFFEPACPDLRSQIGAVARKVIAKSPDSKGARVTWGGTYVNMEGPMFSTRAESHAYRQMGFDVIGMTSLGEAKLCREAEICYQAIAMVTDYDCWHESEEPVTIEMIVGNLVANTTLAKDILRAVIVQLPAERTCLCCDALKNGIMTNPAMIPAKARKRLGPIVAKYL